MNGSSGVLGVEGEEEVLPLQLRVCLSVYLVTAMLYYFFANAMITGYLRKAQRVFCDLDNVSLTLLDHLALSDALYQILQICPVVTTTISGRWLLGDTLCLLNSVVKYIPLTASLYFILLLVLIQVGRVGRSEEFIYSRSTTPLGHRLCATLWLLACIPALAALAVRPSPATYSPWTLGCVPDLPSSFDFASLTSTYLTPLALLSLALAILVFQCCLCSPNSFDSRALLAVEVAVVYVVAAAPSLTVRLVGFYHPAGVPEWCRPVEGLSYTLFILLRPLLFLSPGLVAHVRGLVCCGRGRGSGSGRGAEGGYKVLSEPVLIHITNRV